MTFFMQKFAFLGQIFSIKKYFLIFLFNFSLLYMCSSLRKRLYFEILHSLCIFKKFLKTPNILVKFSIFDSNFMQEDEIWNFFHYFFHVLWVPKHKKNYRRINSKEKVVNQATLVRSYLCATRSLALLQHRTVTVKQGREKIRVGEKKKIGW